MDGWSIKIAEATTWILPLLFAVVFHEVAHGYVAFRLGDPTAKQHGRLTLNPLRHLDPVGSALLPSLLLFVNAPFLFGWAKPVPVTFSYLRNPRRDMVLVALAGPAVNLCLAFISVALFVALPNVIDYTDAQWVFHNMQNFIQINIILAVFNMIPIPPLDGGRVAVGILPRTLAYYLARLEGIGFMVVIGVIFLLPMIGTRLGIHLDPIGPFLNWASQRIISFFLWVLGV